MEDGTIWYTLECHSDAGGRACIIGTGKWSLRPSQAHLAVAVRAGLHEPEPFGNPEHPSKRAESGIHVISPLAKAGTDQRAGTDTASGRGAGRWTRNSTRRPAQGGADAWRHGRQKMRGGGKKGEARG